MLQAFYSHELNTFFGMLSLETTNPSFIVTYSVTQSSTRCLNSGITYTEPFRTSIFHIILLTEVENIAHQSNNVEDGLSDCRHGVSMSSDLLLPVFPPPGSRGAIVVAEARSSDHPSLTRRCVVMKLTDFTLQGYEEALRQNAAAVLILLPSNTSAVPHEVIQVQ